MSVNEIESLLKISEDSDIDDQELINAADELENRICNEDRLLIDHLTEFETNRSRAHTSPNQHGGAQKLYKLSGRRETDNLKYKCKQIEYLFTSTDTSISDFLTANAVCQQFISEICHDYILSIHNENVKVGAKIEHEAFHTFICFPLRNKNEFSPEILWQKIERVVQF